MRKKLMIPVIGLVLIVLGMFAATLWVTQAQKDEGLLINLAGRQRMLSQKMTKEVLHFHTNWTNTGMDEGALGNKVLNTMEVFDRTLKALTYSGDAPLGLDLNNTEFRFCPEAKEPAYSQLLVVEDLWQELSKNLQSVVNDPANGEETVAWIMQNNIPLLQEMNKAVTMMQKQSENNVRRLVVLQITGIVLALLCVAFFFRITLGISAHLHVIIDTLRESARQVADNSGAIASSSQTLADGATRQAASIEESSAAIEEMSAMTKHNAENSDKANHLMKDTNQDVERANSSMDQLIRSMEEIAKASEETSLIIKTIDEVAFQTNLLALNAAVEAARAGAAGAGFAVVADEVRNLATRAAAAAKNTSELIEETVHKVERGREVVNAANKTFKDVIESSRKVGQLIEEIASASTEQAEGIGQINQAISEVDDVIQKTVAISEESASSAEETNAQVLELNRIISELRQIVDTGSMGADSRRTMSGKALTEGAPATRLLPGKSSEPMI